MATVQQAFDLALQYHQAGRLAEAEALYRQILTVQPNHADALHCLGVIAHQMGRHGIAIELIRQAIASNPRNSAAHSNLAGAYRMIGRLEEAISSYRCALQLNPDNALIHQSLANAFFDLEQLDEASAEYRRVLELNPGYPEAHNDLGIALARLGHLDEATAAFRSALALNPGLVSAYNNLGKVLTDRGQLNEAVAVLRRALELKPDFAESHNNLGIALRNRGQRDEAVAALRRALELKPGYAEALNNLGNALMDLGQLDEAVAAHEQAIQLDHDFARAHNNLGITLKARGEHTAAFAEIRRALRLKPGCPWVHSNLIYTLHFNPNQDGDAIIKEQRRWNRQFCEPVKRFISPHTNGRNSERRLRIGYVSPDFREHVIGLNLLPLFNHHDPHNFEVLCYATVVRPDKLTEGFRQRAERWRDTVGVPDEALAELIRHDGIDILVDLTQHIAGNRLPVFARKPAPVQVSFAGYPESTGVETIEYRISDRWLEAKDARSSAFTRRPPEGGTPSRQSDLRAECVFLIDSFWCYDPCGMEIEVNGLPANANGHVTFGCLNNFCKVNEPMLRLWARALREVKESRLVMLSGLGSHRQRTMELLEGEGVAAQRVEFVEPRPRREYLELYHRLDVVLDTFPYNGHTTSLDALWMGVPVVSLAGEPAVSRAGLSQLANLGLPELVAHAEDEYVEIATRLADDLPRLAELRRTLRGRMEAAVLMDAPRFARSIETAYCAMWRRWCAKGAS